MKQPPVYTFFSCADQDSSICAELETQLAVLRDNGKIETWYEAKMLPGKDKAEERQQHFEKADIILLFISPDFFSSLVCIEQMSRALRKAEAEGTLVIPIIIRPFDWRSSPIGHLQPLPHNGNPIPASGSREAELLEVANGIKMVVEQKFSVSLVSSLPRPQPSLSLSGFITSLERIRGLTTNCVGREDNIEQLRSDFANQHKHLIIIGGLAGMGKTTLAAQFATEISKEYNVLWVNCEVIPVTADIFLREIGRVASDYYKQSLLRVILENPTIRSDEKEDALLTFLADISHLDQERRSYASPKPIVLFLDGYHRVEDPALNQLVLKIAKSKVGAKIVLTLRQMPSAFELEIGFITEIALSGLSETSCRQLMELQTKSYPALRDLDDEMFSRVWKRTRGVPAALVLLIAMTRNRTLEDVLEQLPGKDEDVFAEMMRRLSESLFKELSEEERQVAIEASIFRRPMARRALIAVSQCPEADQIIDKLINRFVLTFDGKQLSMNALVLDYTKPLLPFSKAKELHHRAAEFYSAYRGRNPAEKLLSQQESCYHFIRAEEKEQAEPIFTEIAASLRDGGFFQEFFDILNQIEQGGRAIGPALILEKSIVLYKQGEVNRAIATLEHLESSSDKQIEIKIKAQQELGSIFIDTGKHVEGMNYLQQSREIAQNEKLPILEVKALAGLQAIAYHQCDYDQALAYNEERISILEKFQDEQKISKETSEKIRGEIDSAKRAIANVYRERGEYAEALELYQEALAFWHERKSSGETIGWLLYDIGQVYRDEEKYQEAYRQFEMAFEIFHKMPHVSGQAHTEIELGRVGFKVGKPDAIALVQRAIKTLKKIRGSPGVAYGMGALGQVYLWNGQLESALEAFKKSMEGMEGLRSFKGIACALHQMGLVYFEQGKQFLKTGNRAEACSCFLKAQNSIEDAKRFFLSSGTIPNIYGIQNDDGKTREKLADCNDI